MERLVIRLDWGDSMSSEPFKYKSKLDFMNDVHLFLIDNCIKKGRFDTGTFDISYYDLNNAYVNQEIYTLDEWFETFKN